MKEASYAPILVTLQPDENEGNAGNAFAHGGHEFLFVLEGEGALTVVVDEEKSELQEQQSIMFDASKRIIGITTQKNLFVFSLFLLHDDKGSQRKLLHS